MQGETRLRQGQALCYAELQEEGRTFLTTIRSGGGVQKVIAAVGYLPLMRKRFPSIPCSKPEPGVQDNITCCREKESSLRMRMPRWGRKKLQLLRPSVSGTLLGISHMPALLGRSGVRPEGLSSVLPVTMSRRYACSKGEAKSLERNHPIKISNDIPGKCVAFGIWVLWLNFFSGLRLQCAVIVYLCTHKSWGEGGSEVLW